jgi:hypothetical protein
MTISLEEHAMEMTFEQYVAAINVLAGKEDALQSDGTYCDAESWRTFYEDGYTPQDAWDCEKSYWESA